jgi:hypothetical protein
MSNINNNQSFQKGVIDRLEGDKAVIRLDDGQQVIWPMADLPEGAAEGEAVRLVLYTAKDDQAEREQMAKTILNEILKDQSEENE